MSTRRPRNVDPGTSAKMRNVRQNGTAAELAVRAVATELGLRYRVSNRGLAGSPDLANRARRWAVFVHGCFWHRHTGCSRTTTPKRNRAFWVRKFEDNQARDARVVAALRRAGWRVVVLWECEAEQPALVRWRLRPLVGRQLSSAHTSRVKLRSS